MSEEATAGWDAVDAADDSDAFRDYLDRVTGLAGMRAVKRRSRRLLAPTTGDRLLDVGCGTGEDVRALADAVGATGCVLGTDNSTAMLRTARDRTDDVAAAYVTADAHALGFPTGTFDGVRADRVLQHVETPEAAFGELVRVTRPGGRIAVTEPDWGSLVVGAPGVDPAVTRGILDPTYACARNPRVGRRLHAWTTGADLRDAELDTGVIAFTDLDTADAVLGLTGRIETLETDADRAGRSPDAWYETLEAADDAGTFFASLALVTVAATKA